MLTVQQEMTTTRLWNNGTKAGDYADGATAQRCNGNGAKGETTPTAHGTTDGVVRMVDPTMTMVRQRRTRVK